MKRTGLAIIASHGEARGDIGNEFDVVFVRGQGQRDEIDFGKAIGEEGLGGE